MVEWGKRARTAGNTAVRSTETMRKTPDEFSGEDPLMESSVDGRLIA